MDGLKDNNIFIVSKYKKGDLKVWFSTIKLKDIITMIKILGL